MKMIFILGIILIFHSSVFASATSGKKGMEGWEKVRTMSSRSSSFVSTGEEKNKTLEQQLLEEEAKLRESIRKLSQEMRSKNIIVPYVIECGAYPEWIDKDEWNFSFSEKIYFQPFFVNTTNWEIVGIQYQLRFIDSFGKDIYNSEYQDDIRIRPYDFARYENIVLVWENDLLSSDDLYDKLLIGVRQKTIKVQIDIKKIAWANGKTTTNYPENVKQKSVK